MIPDERKAMKSLITRLIFGGFASMLGGGAALAHSKMSGSTPGNGSKVESLIENIELTFDRKVRLTLVDMHEAPEGTDLEEIMAMMGEDMDHEVEGQTPVAMSSTLPKGFVDSATVSFDPLEVGVYMLHWIAIAQDGHVMEGDVHFAVASGE